MTRLRLLTVLGAMIIALGAFPAGVGATHPAHRTMPAVRHLPVDPQSPAFAFGLKGGFSTIGSFTVTIYAGGGLKLQKGQPNSSIRLINPQARIYPIALTALLKLAQAEGFFTMPARIVAKHPVSDVAEAFVSVYTTAGVKKVTVVGANPTPFYELYTLLNYVAGATS